MQRYSQCLEGIPIHGLGPPFKIVEIGLGLNNNFDVVMNSLDIIILSFDAL